MREYSSRNFIFFDMRKLKNKVWSMEYLQRFCSGLTNSIYWQKNAMLV
jgi:hypothetical protein